MRRPKWISPLFFLAAVYDAGLGLLFLLGPHCPFRLFNVTPPNHWGYVEFPAALLIIFGMMFFEIGRDPAGNRNLIPYGILLKVAYCGLVFRYWLAPEGIPDMWKPLAVCDATMGVLFVWAYVVLRPRAENQSSA